MLDFSSKEVQAHAQHMEQFLEDCKKAYSHPAVFIQTEIQ
jgi:hypothetical protein